MFLSYTIYNSECKQINIRCLYDPILYLLIYLLSHLFVMKHPGSGPGGRGACPGVPGGHGRVAPAAGRGARPEETRGLGLAVQEGERALESLICWCFCQLLWFWFGCDIGFIKAGAEVKLYIVSFLLRFYIWIRIYLVLFLHLRCEMWDVKICAKLNSGWNTKS